MSDFAGTTHSVQAKGAKASDSAVSIRFSDTVVAYAILRLSFGANILLHGVSRLLAGHAAFLAYLTHYFEKTPIVPATLLPVFATAQPWVELVLGLLLLLGLWTRFSLIVGGLVMTMLVVGTNLAQDWTVAGLQLIYCFIYCYLLTHREQNVISLDSFWSR
jgi:thiosulfate dehydrogenase (quinone) large subunit